MHTIFPINISSNPSFQVVVRSSMAPRVSNSKPKPFFIFVVFLFFLFILLSFGPKPKPNITRRLQIQVENPNWFDLIKEEFNGNKVKIGLVNIDDQRVIDENEFVDLVDVNFDQVDKDLKWEDFFPEWIDEDETWSRPKCPKIPMPMRMKEFRDLDVVVARVPCGKVREREGIRDVFRLQVNLVVANLVVNRGWAKPELERPVYVVFIGSCGPMWEIFRCDDLVIHRDDYWIYKPELKRLKQKVLMPVGSCELSNSHEETGLMSESTQRHRQREAYVTILHSSEAYVCGAIALAQSIRQSNSTKDLILLADHSISSKSRSGLRSAGWKIVYIHRIRNPNARKNSYNEWNYSKLRLWQLIDYDKVIFLDSDLLVLKNMDLFFNLPQLSAAGNDRFLFNSGVMVVEPSVCMFEELMLKSFQLRSYNGGDQGFLNEVFTFWHRLPKRINFLKIYKRKPINDDEKRREIPPDLYAIHYLGLKPWMCYQDYDCNWDMPDHHHYGSDSAHRRWWKVYGGMAEELRPYCGLTAKMEERIRKWRWIAQNLSSPDEHWKIQVSDPRQNFY